MIRITFLLVILLISMVNSIAALRFNGALLPPVAIKTTAETGLDAAYVVNTTNGLSIVYTAASAESSIVVATFGNRGAVETEEVDASNITRNGKELIISNIKGDCGYAFTESGRTTYYWITDYSTHPYNDCWFPWRTRR